MTVVWWLVLTICWGWLMGPRGAFEYVVGAVLSAGILVLVDRARRRGLLGRMTVPAQTFWQALRLPDQLLTDGTKVAAATLRALAGAPVPGRFLEERLDSPPYPARRRGHRAAVTFLRSFAPNEYVIVIDPETGMQLVHQFVEKRR